MRSMNWAFAAVVLLLAGLFTTTSAVQQGVCIKLGYVGPVSEVINHKATKLALATDNAALAMAASVGSLVAGEVPVVGSFLGFFFDAVMANFLVDQGDTIQAVYDSLFKEIQALRKYVDQKIQAINLQYIKDIFGTKDGGLLGIANYCYRTFKGDADEMSHCLEKLRTTLIEQYHFFMPDDDDVKMNELTLPLFREYGQMYVETLLEQINVAKQRGKDSIAATHTEVLIEKIKKFKEHAVNAMENIFKDQTKMTVKEGSKDCFQGLCTCTILIGPEHDTSKGEHDNTCAVVCTDCHYPCERAKNTYRKSYLKDHATAIATYWKKQLLNTVKKWDEIREKLENSASGSRKRWLVKILADAVIRREERMMRAQK